MSGIAGCFSTDPAAKRRVAGMMQLLGPRAGNPATQVVASSEWANLYVSADCDVIHNGEYFVVVDGRLDGLQTLAEKLGTRAESAWVVLAAWRRWGDACVEHLSGDYVLVIMTPHELFCARDPVGSKPFYYHQGSDGFCFASEAMAIGRMLRLPLNESRIADSLIFTLEHVDKVSTFFAGVNRLPPGATLVVQHGRIKIQPFWRAVAAVSSPEPKLDDAVAEFSALLQRAVDCRVDSGTTALSLSGGVDSGTILGFAGSRVTAVSALSPEGEICEDSHYIRMLTSDINCAASFCELEALDAMSTRVMEQLEQLSEPFDYYMLLSMLTSRTAVEAGCRVMLDGVEGDLLYSLGTSYPSRLLRAGEVQVAFREAKGVYEHSLAREGSLAGWYYRCVRGVGLPRPLWFLKSLKRTFVSRKLEAPEQTLIHPEFAAQTRVLERLADSGERLYGGYVDLTEQHRRNVEHPALAAALERYDRVVSWHGVEPRHPLMDISLIEYALTLPWHMKSRCGWSKFLLRKAGRGRIPGAVSWREGREENAWRFLDRFTDLNRTYMRESLAADIDLLRDYIEPERLRRAHDDDLQQLFVLGRWLRRVHTPLTDP